MAEQNYSELKSQLDELIIKLEDDSLNIDEAIKLYEKIQVVATQMDGYLKTSEAKIKKLTKG